MLSLTACSNTKLTYCERRNDPFIDEVVISSHFNIIDGITITSKIDLNQIKINDNDIENYIKANKDVMDEYSSVELDDNYFVKIQRYVLEDMPLEDVKKYISNTMCDRCFVDYKKSIEHLKYQGFYCSNQ